jgi:hypothetical protein
MHAAVLGFFFWAVTKYFQQRSGQIKAERTFPRFLGPFPQCKSTAHVHISRVWPGGHKRSMWQALNEPLGKTEAKTEVPRPSSRVGVGTKVAHSGGVKSQHEPGHAEEVWQFNSHSTNLGPSRPKFDRKPPRRIVKSPHRVHLPESSRCQLPNTFLLLARGPGLNSTSVTLFFLGRVTSLGEEFTPSGISAIGW